jgi:hypothetical protein
MAKTETLTLGWPSRAVSSWIRDWPTWWNGLSTQQKILPAAGVMLYWLILMALGGFRGDHVMIGSILLVLSYGGRGARQIRSFAMPFLLTAIIYDSQRFYSDYIRGAVHVTQPYFFDQHFFGIHTADGRVLTPNEWWQLHTSPMLDFLCGLAYLVFFTVFIAESAYFYFFLSRTGTENLSPQRVREKSTRMIWSFLWLNLIGYSTYYWYAASPPWYVALYGLGPARLDVPANPGGCIRFDQMLGTHFFSEMYGRAADVHGAIPSLHVAYPLLAVVFAFQFKRLRIFSVLFYLHMCFSAVYLNHHYLLDILWGSSYTLLTALAVDLVCEWRAQPARQVALA